MFNNVICASHGSITAVPTPLQSKPGTYKLCLLFNKLQSFFIFITAQKARNLQSLNDLLSNNQHLLGSRGERTEELDSALIGKFLLSKIGKNISENKKRHKKKH